MAFNMIKPAIPKIATTIGLSGLSAGISHGIDKALNKKKILEIDEKTMNQIKQNLKKINDSKVFDRKVTLKGVVHLAFYCLCWQVLLFRH